VGTAGAVIGLLHRIGARARHREHGQCYSVSSRSEHERRERFHHQDIKWFLIIGGVATGLTFYSPSTWKRLHAVFGGIVDYTPSSGQLAELGIMVFGLGVLMVAAA